MSGSLASVGSTLFPKAFKNVDGFLEFQIFDGVRFSFQNTYGSAK